MAATVAAQLCVPADRADKAVSPYHCPSAARPLNTALGGNMVGFARIVGVYPVKAREPCHLCEVLIEDGPPEVNFGEFTQPLAGRDPGYWQVPYDERLVSSSSACRTYVFFFHYLNLSQPMQSPFGDLALPKPTERPERLKFVAYEEP